MSELIPKGIVIVATGHPYYGRMAYNLAVSIRASESKLPVCVLTNGAGLSHLTDSHKRFFDYIIEVEESGVMAKLSAWRYSPFQETMLIDADTLWIIKRKPEELFETLAGSNFTAITEGYFDCTNGEHDIAPHYLFWADPNEIKEAYHLKGLLYQWRSEVMYWRRCDETHLMFMMAEYIYKCPLVETVSFSGGVADEFALNIAACMAEMHPHQYKWQPTYWELMYSHPKVAAEIVREFWIYSVGGNNVSSSQKRIYNSMSGAAHYKLGLHGSFTLLPKKYLINERSTA